MTHGRDQRGTPTAHGCRGLSGFESLTWPSQKSARPVHQGSLAEYSIYWRGLHCDLTNRPLRLGYGPRQRENSSRYGQPASADLGDRTGLFVLFQTRDGYRPCERISRDRPMIRLKGPLGKGHLGSETGLSVDQWLNGWPSHKSLIKCLTKLSVPSWLSHWYGWLQNMQNPNQSSVSNSLPQEIQFMMIDIGYSPPVS